MDVASTRKPIDDIMYTDCFTVHDIMFNVKDLVQCILLCSTTLYDSIVHNKNCNAFLFTIDNEFEWIMAIPVMYNKDLTESILRNNTDYDIIKKNNGKNTYTICENGKITMMITKGYIIDNFRISKPRHDFLLDGVEGDSTVVLESTDIESLTVKNPMVR